VCLVKTSSGLLRSIGVVAAAQSDPRKRLYNESDRDVEEDERNGDTPGDRYDRGEGEPDGLFGERQHYVAILAVVEDAAFGIASSSFAPHVSVMQPANAGERDHLRVR
jgi:hypothetical protein